MQIIQEADFRKQIKNIAASTEACAYIFVGEEDYTKVVDANAIADAVCPDLSLKMFNETRMDALNYSPDRLLDAFMTQPVMGERRVIILSGMYPSSMKEEELNALTDVLAQIAEYPHVVFVFSIPADGMDIGVFPGSGSARTPARPSPMLTRFGEYLTPVLFPHNSPAQLAAWLQRHFRTRGIQASPAFCKEMLGYCGSDMFRLAAEVAKLAAYVSAHNRTEVTEEDLRNVAVQGTEFGAFDFSNAIMAGDTNAAFRVLADMKLRRADPIAVFGEVSRIFCDALSVRLLTERGMTQNEIAATLKWKNAGRVLVYQRNKMTTKRLMAAVRICADADRSVKLGSKDYAVLEQLLCSL